MLHQVGDLFELNVKLRCQKVNHSHTSLTKHNPAGDTTSLSEIVSHVTANLIWNKRSNYVKYRVHWYFRVCMLHVPRICVIIFGDTPHYKNFCTLLLFSFVAVYGSNSHGHSLCLVCSRHVSIWTIEQRPFPTNEDTK